MKRCLKMIINTDQWDSDWGPQIQKQAKKLEIEGLMQAIDIHQMRVMICGEDHNLDDFVDYLYDFFSKIEADITDLEPFIKERDFRGIFRVI